MSNAKRLQTHSYLPMSNAKRLQTHIVRPV